MGGSIPQLPLEGQIVWQGGLEQGALLLGCQLLSDACGDGVNAHAAFAGGSGGVAQSAAFSNISEDVANAQTVGFKRVDTSFVDFLAYSTPTQNEAGGVLALPQYRNNLQGTISQTSGPLNMAIAGSGFFTVSERIGSANGAPVFASQAFYTRAGDFQADAQGYMINTAGYYLNGWLVNPTTNTLDKTVMAPIQVGQDSIYNPVQTSAIDLSANLPATPAAGTATTANPLSSSVNVYDALGVQRTIDLKWSQQSTNVWTVEVDAPSLTPSSLGTAQVTFGQTAGTGVPAGTTNANQALMSSSPRPASALVGTSGI